MLLNESLLKKNKNHSSGTIITAVPRAAHAISVATFLFPPADQTGRSSLMRTMAVSPNFTFFIIGARVDLVMEEGEW